MNRDGFVGVNVHAYEQKIKEILGGLRSSGVIKKYRHNKKHSSGTILCFYLSNSKLPRDLRVHFVLGGMLNDDERTANFVAIRLSPFPEAIDVNTVQSELGAQIASRIRGSRNESVVIDALKGLKRSGEIHGFSKAQERDDIRGSDVLVYFFGGDSQNEYLEMPLQVKSSVAGQEKHIERHSDIPSVVVEGADPVGRQQVKEKIRMIVDAFRRDEIEHL